MNNKKDNLTEATMLALRGKLPKKESKENYKTKLLKLAENYSNDNNFLEFINMLLLYIDELCNNNQEEVNSTENPLIFLEQ